MEWRVTRRENIRWSEEIVQPPTGNTTFTDENNGGQGDPAKECLPVWTRSINMVGHPKVTKRMGVGGES